MNRREALKTAAAMIAGPAVLRASGRHAGDKPNLLFICADQQRADTMAVYGNRGYRVPAINRLASESVVFDRCYVTHPICTPSRTSLMTGLWPHTTGNIRNNIPLKRETKALPELLGDSDYRTAFMGKWHLGDEAFAQHGFQEWQSVEDIYNPYFSRARDRNARSAYHRFLLQLGYKPDADNLFPRSFAANLPVEHTKASFLANEACRFIMENRKRPWLLCVNPLEPHPPFSSVLNDLHEEGDAPLPLNYPGVPEREPAWYRARRERLIALGKTRFDAVAFDLAAREGWQRMNRNYAGLCSLLDQALARILWAVEVSGVAANTIVAYTSDHGEMLGAHTMMAKNVMYEEAVRVPLLLRVPFRTARRQRITQPVSHIDLVPTLLHLLGRRPCCGLAGHSLLPVVDGSRPDNGDVFIEWQEDSHDPFHPGVPGRAVVSSEGWKLAVYNGDSGLLFERGRDPLELDNLFGRGDSAATVRRLRSRIEEWQRRTADKFPLPD